MKVVNDVVAQLKLQNTLHPADFKRVLLARHVISKEYAEQEGTVCTEASPGVFTQSALGLLNTALAKSLGENRIAVICDGEAVTDIVLLRWAKGEAHAG